MPDPVSYTDDPAGDGESLKIEKLSDPAVVFDVGELVRGAETADAFIEQEAARKAAEEEAFGDAGHYSTTDVFTFEAGGAYEISSGTRGDFYSDDAGGFTGQ